jgi:hypothetical protein
VGVKVLESDDRCAFFNVNGRGKVP